ncbi:Subtilisin-like protease [Melia azedarach]|uniref:Subtilisin-like protease n=1 Tax=Melia azedarach TaxID=155640 RepID=A0ACC1Z2J9_MELAZ|nr:Subtilisin-like protease [Melia azedarach]
MIIPKMRFFSSYKRHTNGFAAKLDDDDASSRDSQTSQKVVFGVTGFCHSFLPFCSCSNAFSNLLIIFYSIPVALEARYFNKGYASVVGPLNSSFEFPRDNDAHGSHILSTAGGNFVAKATFDMAIHDGVDVLSISLGGKASAFLSDSIAIGSFHAVKHGIVVIFSAGSSGPADGTVSNVAPWQITVGASKMDRDFPSYVVLGNNARFKGQSLSDEGLLHKKFKYINGKRSAFQKNGIGLFADPRATRFTYQLHLWHPVGHVTQATTELGTKPSTLILKQSPKGPNTITPVIVKLDITSRSRYYSRTSTSCPHVSGIAGLLKILYPNCSSAAIKSAIMTTETMLDD